MPHFQALTFQLLGRDEILPEDEDAAQKHWQAYVLSYAKPEVTANLPIASLRRPYLKRYVLTHICECVGADEYLRHLHNDAATPEKPEGMRAESGLEIKICMRSLKLFFAAGGEDWLRLSAKTPDTSALQQKQKERFASWFEKRAEAIAAATASAEAEAKELTAAEDSTVVASVPTETSAERTTIDEAVLDTNGLPAVQDAAPKATEPVEGVAATPAV